MLTISNLKKSYDHIRRKVNLTDLPSSLLASHKPSAIQRAFSIPKSQLLLEIIVG